MKRLLSPWWALITLAFLVYTFMAPPAFLQSIKLNYFDQLIVNQEPVENNIYVARIDELALERYGQYPFPRNDYADIIQQLYDMGAGLVVWNVMMPETDRLGGDAELAETMLALPVILASRPSDKTKNEPINPGAAILQPQFLDRILPYGGIIANIPELENNSVGAGIVSTEPEIDGVVRRMPTVAVVDGTLYPSLALETLRALYDMPNYNTKVTPEVGIEWIRMGRAQPIETTPTSDVMISYWNKFERISASELVDANLTNKVLVWGLTAEGLNNPISTPVGVLYPHEVQANQIQTVLQEVRIQQSYYLEFLEVVLLVAVLLGILASVYMLPTTLSAIVSLGIVGLQLGGGFWIWISNYVLFDTFVSSISSMIVFGHASFNKYYVTYQLKEQIKKQFQKYLSPDMVEELQKDPSKLKLGGERREMTFLFMDICGFTPISEAYKNRDDPEGLVELINKFLDVQTKIILNNKGTIDKYMGDCIMAFWNAPLDCEDHATLAVKSAKEISEKADELIKELIDDLEKA